MNVFAASLVLAGALANVAIAQPLRIAYRIAMPDPASHIYDVSMDVGGARGDTLPLQLPVWSPGRYARMDFARNIQEFRATDDAGRPLSWDKTNGSRWIVLTKGTRNVHLRYRVFANALSGTFSVLDSAHANWNGAALFMYVEGHKPDPVTLDVVVPAGWHVINGDTRTVDQTAFHFENYDRLIDTPTEVAPAVMLDSFVVDGRRYRTMVHHNGPVAAATRERFVRDVEKIVRYENSVFAPPPLEQYTFLFNIGYPGGDGMEHLYSTQIISRTPWQDSVAVLPGISTAAHEYFHVWNVKRVRPAALGPFDYTREQYQPSLWVAEGWTQYYGLAALGRAGIVPTSAFYATMGGLIQSQPHGAGPQGGLGAHGVVPRALLGRWRAAAAHQWSEHLLLVLHQGRRAGALSRPLAAREERQRESARRRVRVAQAPELERAEVIVLSAGPGLHRGRCRARCQRDRR